MEDVEASQSWLRGGEAEAADRRPPGAASGLRGAAAGLRGPAAVLLGCLWLASVAAAWSAGHRSGSQTAPPAPRGVIGLAEQREAEAKPKAAGLHAVYAEALAAARHVDLTHAFSPTSPVWPGFGNSSFSAGVCGAAIEGFAKKGEEYTWAQHGFATTAYVLTTDQLGTQLDPPAHWNEFGATISDIPATYAVRPLVVIDIHAQVAKNGSYHAAMSDVTAWEAKYGTVPKGSVVMFRSDWYKGWESYQQKGLPDEYPGVQLDVLKFLHTERGILFHGHEPLDTDMTPTLEGEAWLMHENYPQAEGVANLDQVPETGCLVSIGFAKPLGGTGGYARYVAICPPDAPNGEVPGAALPRQRHPLRRDDFGVLRPTPGAEATKYCAPDTPGLGCEDGKPVWTS